jgi:hypothetical protein
VQLPRRDRLQRRAQAGRCGGEGAVLCREGEHPEARQLSQNKGRCIVRVWEQGERVTVAFQQCEKMCSGNAHSYLWPILNDRNKGSCA